MEDSFLISVSSAWKTTLRSIDLSRSRSFSNVGLSNLVTSCTGLVEINLSNGVALTDAVMKVLAEAKNLEKLWLSRCKSITDMGIGCVAVGCKKLKLLCLNWCLHITDLGVGLIATKCKELRSLDLSFLTVFPLLSSPPSLCSKADEDLFYRLLRNVFHQFFNCNILKS